MTAHVYTLLKNAYERMAGLYKPEEEPKKRHMTVLARLIKACVYLDHITPGSQKFDVEAILKLLDAVTSDGKETMKEHVDEIVNLYNAALAKYKTCISLEPALEIKGPTDEENIILSRMPAAAAKAAKVRERDIIMTIEETLRAYPYLADSPRALTQTLIFRHPNLLDSVQEDERFDYVEGLIKMIMPEDKN